MVMRSSRNPVTMFMMRNTASNTLADSRAVSARSASAPLWTSATTATTCSSPATSSATAPASIPATPAAAICPPPCSLRRSFSPHSWPSSAASSLLRDSAEYNYSRSTTRFLALEWTARIVERRVAFMLCYKSCICHLGIRRLAINFCTTFIYIEISIMTSLITIDYKTII